MTAKKPIQERVGLRIGGNEWSAWSDVSITRSIEQVCSTAALSITNINWTAEKPTGDYLEILPSMACEIYIGADQWTAERVLTGYVDADDTSTTEGASYKLEVRSKVADLVDCTHLHGTGVFRGMKLEEIAAELAKPYDLGVTCITDTGPVVAPFRCEKTETVVKAIERLCKERGLLLTDDAYGNLVIGTVAAPNSGTVATLRRGINLKSLSRHREVSSRFNHYVIRGQTADDYGAEGKTDDLFCLRNRTMCIDSEKAANSADCLRRAEWEASTRAGKSVRYEAAVAGWRTDPTDAESPLWEPNTLVRLVDDVLGIDDDVLVVRCQYQRSVRGGTTTALSLGYPEGYTPQPGKYRRSQGKGTGKKGTSAGWAELRGGVQ